MLGSIVCYVCDVVMYIVMYADTKHKMNSICRHLDGHSSVFRYMLYAKLLLF